MIDQVRLAILLCTLNLFLGISFASPPLRNLLWFGGLLGNWWQTGQIAFRLGPKVQVFSYRVLGVSEGGLEVGLIWFEIGVRVVLRVVGLHLFGGEALGQIFSRHIDEIRHAQNNYMFLWDKNR